MLFKLIFSDLKRHCEIFCKPETFANYIRISLSNRFLAVLIIRLTHFFYVNRLHVLAKMTSTLNTVFFKIEVALKCQIGGGLFFPHPFCIVIGADKIGENCILYHNVTLGAKYLDIKYTRENRPTLGKNVIIGTGTVVIGGIFIGSDVGIGPNQIIVNSIQNGVKVLNK
jgi:serine O-acetyltransferase